MQALEITASPSVVRITVERAALDGAMVARIVETLQALLTEQLSQNPVKRRFSVGMGKEAIGELPHDFDAPLEDFKEHME